MMRITLLNKKGEGKATVGGHFPSVIISNNFANNHKCKQAHDIMQHDSIVYGVKMIQNQFAKTVKIMTWKFYFPKCTKQQELDYQPEARH